jgi:hypothetical protein
MDSFLPSKMPGRRSPQGSGELAKNDRDAEMKCFIIAAGGMNNCEEKRIGKEWP